MNSQIIQPATNTSRAWVELNLQALRQNVLFLQSRLPKDCQLMPAIKAEAYGHGAFIMAEQLHQMGIRSFCVACADEAIALRRQNIQDEILILGYTHPEQFPALHQYRLLQTVVDEAYAEELEQYGRIHGITFPVHLAVDTGMHRLGESSENPSAILRIFSKKHLKIEGLFTHLSADDSLSPDACAFTEMQMRNFNHIINQIKKQGLALPKIHSLASYGILNYPQFGGDYARAGIALYGVLSTLEDSLHWQNQLSPVLSLKARIASIRPLHCGECAGYGLDYKAPRDMQIAALTIGYADGLPRSLSNGIGSVLVNGYPAPIVGRICMDQTMIDVSSIPENKLAAGDIAVIIGTSGSVSIRAEELAEQSGSITNEILSRLGSRLPRLIASGQDILTDTSMLSAVS